MVDYGFNGTLQADFNAFNAQYGLPAQTLQFICPPSCGTCPSGNGTGWDLETALDVEYAHGMAPNAQIFVAEFCSDPLGDGTETMAAAAVAASPYDGGEVSTSWTYNGGESWCGSGNCELGYDSYFTTPTVVYFGAAGDGGLGPLYPSISPNVVSAGGTRIIRSSGSFTGEEDCWSGSGGGISQYESLPNYQLIIGNRTGPHRGTPDWAADASTSSPVAIYTTTGCGGWCAVGGTSVASPVLAGITNAAGSFANHTPSELQKTYGWYHIPVLYRKYFYDVTKGSNGSPAKLGWDECTGLGSPRNLAGF